MNRSHLGEVTGSASVPFLFHPNQCCQCFHSCINEKGRAYACSLMEGDSVSELNLLHFFFDVIFSVISLKIKDTSFESAQNPASLT